VHALAAAGAGFLLAVIWFDLMFDVQVRAGAAIEPDDAVASIGRYYRRVTTDAFPMNRLVALAMLATLAGVVGQLIAGTEPAWAAWASLPFVAGPIALAGARTVRDAQRLGAGVVPEGERLAVARRILGDHAVCFAGVLVALVLQVATA
jgi:hypothetical protein